MGEGAEEFASGQGLETAGPEWFETERRKKSLERLKAEKLPALDVDQNGNLAAGTSTGGMTGKRRGRIGDAPVIGAGTYADNRSCAVSATGWGEYFIRVGVAQEICTRLRVMRERQKFEFRRDMHDKMPMGTVVELSRAVLSEETGQGVSDDVMAEVKELGGDGGIILVTPEGDALYSFNTSGMYRGRANSEGLNEVAIFGGEDTGTGATPDH